MYNTTMYMKIQYTVEKMLRYSSLKVASDTKFNVVGT